MHHNSTAGQHETTLTTPLTAFFAALPVGADAVVADVIFFPGDQLEPIGDTLVGAAEGICAERIQEAGGGKW